MQQKKKAKKIAPVTKPFMKGSIYDSGTIKSAIYFYFGLLLMVLANLLLGSMAAWDIAWLNIVFNAVLVLMIYAVFYANGANKGTAAVNHGEMMLQRQESGRTVDAKDRAACYHPGKGFLIGVLGSIALLGCAVVLAVTAKMQYSGMGALPSWIGTLQRQPEMQAALAYYNQPAVLTVEDITRLLVRLHILPYVNMVGSTNRAGLLLLERISPVIALLPALSYGLGYTQGVRMRTRVHTDIAAGKRKRAQKERRQRQARVKAAKGPEQLN